MYVWLEYMSAMGEQTDPFDIGDGGNEDSASTVANLREPAPPETDEDVNGLAVLQDEGHEMVPDSGTYVTRRVTPTVNDVEMMAYQMSTGRPTLITGNHGVGKDALVEEVCARTNRPMVRVNFGEGITYSDLVGEFQPVDDADQKKIDKARELADELDIDVHEAASLVGAESQFEFSPGWLYLAVTLGWTFVADELNAAGADATMPLHGVTEDDPYLTVLQTSEMIEPHEQFRFVGTRNPTTYAGTKQMNDAFESRFWPFPLGYLGETGEKVMLQATTALEKGDDEDEAIMDGIVQLAANLRDSHEARDIVTPVGHRSTIKIADLVGDGVMDPKEAARFVLKTAAGREDKDAIDKAIGATDFTA